MLQLRHNTALSVFLALSCNEGSAAAPPNVLIIMADNCSHNDLPLYGGQNAKTPNIDAMAASGLTYNKAYLSSATCHAMIISVTRSPPN